MEAIQPRGHRANLCLTVLPLVLCGAIGCSSPDNASAPDGGAVGASTAGTSVAGDCYDAAHEGRGTVSFQLNGRTVQLAATAAWVKSWLDVGAHDDPVHEGWAMELTPTDVGTHACDLSSGALGMFYSNSDIVGSRYGTIFPPQGACTINVREEIPHFKADFEATMVNGGDAGPPTMLLENGQIDVEMPGWCY